MQDNMTTGELTSRFYELSVTVIRQQAMIDDLIEILYRSDTLNPSDAERVYQHTNEELRVDKHGAPNSEELGTFVTKFLTGSNVKVYDEGYLLVISSETTFTGDTILADMEYRVTCFAAYCHYSYVGSGSQGKDLFFRPMLARGEYFNNWLTKNS